MQIITDKEFNNYNGHPAAVAIGCFDGLHRGHQAIIKKVIAVAGEKNIRSGIFSFKPHPLEILAPDESPEYIISYRQKIKILKELGLDIFFQQGFTKEFSLINFRDFVRNILVGQLNIKQIVVGRDFRFGRERQGKIESLVRLGKKFNFGVDILDPVKIDDRKVSSTLIRELIKCGEVKKASVFLGRNYRVKGRVIPGDGRGRELGIPTANLELITDYVVPAVGVYAVYVFIDEEKYKGIINLGYRPTFAGDNYSIETHIIDFRGDLYGKELGVEFVKYIREERQFSSVDKLVARIKRDILYTDSLLCYNN